MSSRGRSSLLALVAAAVGIVLLLPAAGGAAALTSPIWSVSSPTTADTGVAYTYTFTTASGAALTSVKMTVPAGTSGTPTLGPVSGVPSGGTIALASNTLTYSFTSPFLNSGTAVSIEVDGLTNSSTAGSYTSQITTYVSATAQDTAATGAVSLTSGSLSNPIWNVSNASGGATGVTYSYSFATATAGTLTSVTMAVPPGTGGSPARGTITGLPTTGSVSLASNTLTYSFSGTSVAANTPVTISITGLTNTSVADSYQSQITTNSSGGPVDTGLTAGIALGGGTFVNPIWALSSSAGGATNVSYTYSFTTATGASLTALTMTVPPGTGGTPAVGTITSTASSFPTNGTITLANNTLTYAFPSAFVNPSYSVSIQITGLTNTSTSGTYTSQIADFKSGGVPNDTGTSAPISLSGGQLTNPSWTPSKSTTSATAVTYTYTFTTATAATLTSVTMTVPPGTAGTPARGTVSGLPTTGSVALASNTLTYSFTGTSIAAGVAVTVTFTGLTNTATAGSYQSQITTKASSGPIDSGLTAAIAFTSGALVTPTWTPSATTTWASGVTYTYTFKTANGSSLSSVTMTVPPGTLGTPAVGAISGVPAGGTVSLASDTLTYAFTATFLNPSTSVSIQITGLTNTATVGSYTSQITTFNSITPTGTGTTSSQAFTLGCSGGSLTVASPSTLAWSSALDGTDQTVNAALAVTVDDERGSSAGWNVTGTSTTFKVGTHTLATTATTLVSATNAPNSGNCTLPTNTITYPVTLPAGTTAPTAVKLYNAAASSGRGSDTVTMNFQLSVPANTFVGAYSSTWTISVLTGP